MPYARIAAVRRFLLLCILLLSFLPLSLTGVKAAPTVLGQLDLAGIEVNAPDWVTGSLVVTAPVVHEVTVTGSAVFNSPSWGSEILIRIIPPNGNIFLVTGQMLGLTLSSEDVSFNKTFLLPEPVQVPGTWQFVFEDTLDDGLASYDYRLTSGSIKLIDEDLALDILQSSQDVAGGTVSLTTRSVMTPIDVKIRYAVGPTTLSIVASSLPTGLSFDPATGRISGTPTVAGQDVTLQITASDSMETVSSTLRLVTANPVLGLSLPAGPLVLTRGVAMAAVSATATGGDESYSLSISPALPDGLTLDSSSGAISGTPVSVHAASDFTVTVTDGAASQATAQLQIAVQHPVLGLSLPAGPLVLTRGVAMAAVSATATGGDESYSFSISPALPDGLTLDSSTGEISGTPVSVHAASDFTVTVTDGAASQATAQLQIAVAHPGLALSLPAGSVLLTRGVAMAAVSATATGGDGSYSFAISPALPDGLTLDSSSGEISGTPVSVHAASDFTLTVTDGAASQATAQLQIAVAHPGLALSLPAGPVLLTRGVAMATVSATATGGDESYSFAISPALPDGLTLDSSSGEISGTPVAAHAASDFTVTVTDGTASQATAQLQIAVAHPGLALSLSDSSIDLITGVAMTPVTAHASGGDGSYAFTISPALPEGLSLDPAAGSITGTPASTLARSPYTITLRDGSGASQTATLAIAINHSAMTLSLSQSRLTLIRGEAVPTVTASASGGDGRYSFTIAPPLPAGLIFDAASGALSGSPTSVTGAGSHTITVSDGSGLSASAMLQIEVSENLTAVVESFENRTGQFIQNRIRRGIAAEPRGYRFENRRSGLRELTARAREEGGMFFLAANNVSVDGGRNLWVEASYSRYDFNTGTGTGDQGDGRFGMVSLGADILLSPDLAFGAMVQLDHLDETIDGHSDLSGRGWLAGPYLTGRLGTDLYFRIKAAAGRAKADATIDVFGTGTPFQGSFSARRSQLMAALYGQTRQGAGVNLTPEVEIAYMRESYSAYQVSDGTTLVTIPEGKVDLGQLSLSLLAEMPLGEGQMLGFVRPRIDWGFSGTDGAGSDPLSGSLEVGLRSDGISAWHSYFALRFDGIGDDFLSGHTVEARLSRDF